MSQLDRRLQQRQLRDRLAAEFPDFDLVNWYIQYRELKAGHPDAVLLYRLGDFYEAFDDDAKLIADLLEVTLTYKKFANHKKTKAEQRAPMAGMPYHAIERYVSTLVGAGYRVAIAEQVSETASSKSDTRPRSVFAAGLEQSERRRDIVDREVVRVITPGTVIDSGMLAPTQNNYLVAVIAEGVRVGIAYADLSTGEFACTEFGGERATTQAHGELARLQASEVLVPDDTELRLPGLNPASAQLEHDLEFMTKGEREKLLPSERVARRVERENIARWAHGHVTGWPAWRWKLSTATDALLVQLRVHSLDGCGLRDKPLAVRAAGAIIQYIHETQRNAAHQITSLRAYSSGGTMFLDPQTRRNLEILEGSSGKVKDSLVGVLDHTRTPMGGRLLRRWLSQPLIDLEQLDARQEGVQHFFDDTLLRATVREQLKHVGDLERVVNRVLQGITVATPRDMVRLREGLRALPALADALSGWLPQAGGGEKQEEALQTPLDVQPPPSEIVSTEHSEATAPVAHTTAKAPGSLREQREARRSIAPRYADDDLFGDDDWEEAPTTPISASQPAISTRHTPLTHAPLLAPTTEPQVQASGTALDICADVLDFLEQALDDDPPALLGASNYLRAAEENGEQPRRTIRPGFDRHMDDIIERSLSAQTWINELEPIEQERTGIKSLRVGYNKVFGYYIEVARTFADKVPSDYIRKQTLTTGERYITPALKEHEDVVLRAKEKLNELEIDVFRRICTAVASHGQRLLGTARALAAIDVYAALGEAAVRGRYIRPTLNDSTALEISGGRHPVVEQRLDESFIANDTTLDTSDCQIMLITGPNMAGKSTVMRQVALIVLMAQIGSFVPADAATIGLVDRIFTRIGAQDDIATGQSTFMVEMTETAALLVQSTRRSLIVLDEVGRGTSTYDGMAIARAVVEYIHNEPRLGCRTLFATHYHELTELEQTLPRVHNYHMAAVEQEDGVVFLHELRRGGVDRSYGIHVAELAGIPRAVIRRANELLAELEQYRRAPHPNGAASAMPRPERKRREVVPPEQIGQLALFDIAPSPAIELLRRLNINELTPLEALTKLYELQQLARQ